MAHTIAAAPAHASPVFIARVFGPLAQILNPLVMGLAGSRQIPLWAIVRHRGRRSGKQYVTPVAIGHSGDALLIPLPFGTEAQWCSNVRAAGECVMRWKGQEHQMIDPELVTGASGSAAFAAWERSILNALGIRSFLRLRFAPDSAM